MIEGQQDMVEVLGHLRMCHLTFGSGNLVEHECLGMFWQAAISARLSDLNRGHRLMSLPPRFSIFKSARYMSAWHCDRRPILAILVEK